MAITLDFSGQNVVVIGGTSGINLGIADTFAKHGATVTVVSRSQDKVDAAVAQLSAHGNRALGFSADVRDVEAIEKVFQTISDEVGEIDILISGAAGNFPANAIDMSANAFKSVVDIDLLGTYHVMRSAYPHLKKPGASVINISAPQASIALHAQSHVCAAKAGVDMITKCLSLEWGAQGVRVNSIVPGPIDNTEGMSRLAPNQKMRDMVVQSVPLKSFGHTDDIANTAVFLCSPLASYVSGAIIPVDGGWSVSGLGGMSHALEQFAAQ